MAIKHKNPTQVRKDSHGNERPRARAPYNFVPLPDTVKEYGLDDLPRHDLYEKISGRIVCTLTSRTPIYTRSALDPELFDNWDEVRKLLRDSQARNVYAQFYHLVEQARPRIPGSSLRGMVRALVEILASAKMQWVTNQRDAYRTIGDRSLLGDHYRQQMMWEENNAKLLTPKVQAGYMKRTEKGGWEIVPARTHNGLSFARIQFAPNNMIPAALRRWHTSHNAFRIWIRPGVYGPQPIDRSRRDMRWMPVVEAHADPQTGDIEGVLVRSGPMQNKKREAVFFLPDETANPIAISNELERLYRNQVTGSQDEQLGNPEGSQIGVLRDCQPVFYLLGDGGKLRFFGHPMMFRLPYRYTPRDLVPGSLRRTDTVDLAEGIFGFAPQDHEDKRQAYAGRVFFEDATLAAGQGTLQWPEAPDPFAPQILSTPKPTSFQHYLTQQEPDDVNGNPRRRLDHYAGDWPHDKVIRGAKLYWHRAVTQANHVKDAEFAEAEAAFAQGVQGAKNPWATDTQHTIMRPLRAGLTFTFTVRFENLLKAELGLLLWALQPGPSAPEPVPAGATPPDYCHKLGMGKPLGLGSVKVEVTQLYTETKEQRIKRYSTLFAPLGDLEDAPGRTTWNEPATNALAEIPTYKRCFENVMVGRGNSFVAGERIGMLLKMMDWANKPARGWTRYMEIERQEHPGQPNVNEYRERPVLPDPLHIQDNLNPNGAVAAPQPPIMTRPPAGQRPPSLPSGPALAPWGTTPPPAPAGTAPICKPAPDDLAPDTQPAGDAPPPPPTTTPPTTTTTTTTPPDSSGFGAQVIGYLSGQRGDGAPVPPPPAAAALRPATLDGFKPGTRVWVRVKRVESNAIVFQTSVLKVEATLTMEHIIPPTQNHDQVAQIFTIGSEHALYVARINKKGRVQLRMNPTQSQ